MQKVYLLTGSDNLALLQTIQEGLAEVSHADMETLRRGIQYFTFATEAEERAFDRGWSSAYESLPVGAPEYDFLSEETMQDFDEILRRSKERCERSQAPMEDRLCGILQRTKDALAPAWKGHRHGYPTEVGALLDGVLEPMKNPSAVLPNEVDVLGALSQARAALPDKVFAKQSGVDPAVIVELNEAIDHLEAAVAGPSPR